MVLERPLRVSWTAKRSNQSILKEINPDYSLEGLMLKLQYFDHLMQRANLLEKNLMPGKTECRRRRVWRRTRYLNGITDSMQWTWVWANSGRWWRIGKPGPAVHGIATSQTQLSDWITNISLRARHSVRSSFKILFPYYLNILILEVIYIFPDKIFLNKWLNQKPEKFYSFIQQYLLELK